MNRIWLAASITAASLVLGIGATALVYVSGVFDRVGAYAVSPSTWEGPAMGRRQPTQLHCAAPQLPGAVVDVTFTDMGAMMGGGMMGPVWNGYGRPHMPMMHIIADRTTVPAGQVSFRAFNAGRLNHELVVLPLPEGQYPGQRAIAVDGTVDEAGSLGEASRTCGAGKGEGDGDATGDGIAPGAIGWTTVDVGPGRYEVVCNLPGHYGAGMFTELDVTSAAG